MSVFKDGGGTVMCFTAEGPALAGVPVTVFPQESRGVTTFDINLLEGQVPWYVLLGVSLGPRKSTDHSWNCRVMVKWDPRQDWEVLTKTALGLQKCELKDLKFSIHLKERGKGPVFRTV